MKLSLAMQVSVHLIWSIFWIWSYIIYFRDFLFPKLFSSYTGKILMQIYQQIWCNLYLHISLNLALSMYICSILVYSLLTIWYKPDKLPVAPRVCVYTGPFAKYAVSSRALSNLGKTHHNILSSYFWELSLSMVSFCVR